jgi:hypothetical protein
LEHSLVAYLPIAIVRNIDFKAPEKVYLLLVLETSAQLLKFNECTRFQERCS